MKATSVRPPSPMSLLLPLLLAAPLLPACTRPDLPPPVERGRCLVAHWAGSSAIDQTCVLGGYSWRCLRAGALPDGLIGCDRGPEAGELTGTAK